jgi:asparagine synthase (glutamine-hydrolysing)
MQIDEYINTADSIVSDHFKRYGDLFPQVGVLLSGGIDSSVISTYVLKIFTQHVLFSMGTDLTKDKPFVDLFSKHFTVPIEWVELTELKIREALPDVSRLLIEQGVEDTAMQRSLGVGYYLIFKRARELGITGIVTGQGPDILFAGYHKYKGMTGEILSEEIKKDLVLLETDKKRDGAMAAHFGITLLNPYLEEDFVEFSLTVPAEYKIAQGVEKFFMREWGKRRGLPQEIVNRPKKAFQYSTGLQKKVLLFSKPTD